MACVPVFLFLPHFDVICKVWLKQLTYSNMEKQNLFVKYNVISKFLAQDNDFPAFWLVP